MNDAFLNYGKYMEEKPWISVIMHNPFWDAGIVIVTLALLGFAGYVFLECFNVTRHLIRNRGSRRRGHDPHEEFHHHHHKQEQHQIQTMIEHQHHLVSCLACDRQHHLVTCLTLAGKHGIRRALHAVCTPCVLQVLGRESHLISSDNVRRSVEVFLENLQRETNNRSLLVLVQSSRNDPRGATCGCRGRRRDHHHDEDEDGVSRCCQFVEESIGAEREVIDDLYGELEQERGAAAIAASESLAMITRLQEEKSLMLMEAMQYRRIVEEKSFHDEHAIDVLKEMLMRRESEKMVLEEELDVYRRSESGSKLSQATETQSQTSESQSQTEESSGDEEAKSSGDEEATTPVEKLQQRRRSSSKDETSAAIRKLDEQRLSVNERVKLLEQQLQLLKLTDEPTINFQQKRRASDVKQRASPGSRAISYRSKQ